MDPSVARIRKLNDQFRKRLDGGLVFMTPGVAALGPAAVHRIAEAVATFDDFQQANDPHLEHDFGSFDAEGQTVFFKIDYFDNQLQLHSPDPADPSVTTRLLTIMLAEEY
jgi:hypothetical protein